MTIAVGRASCSSSPRPSSSSGPGSPTSPAFPDSIDGVAGIKLLNEKWPQGTELQLAGRRHERRPAGRRRRPSRTLKTEGLEARRAERAGRGHPVARRPGGARRRSRWAAARTTSRTGALVRQARTPARRRPSSAACPTSGRYVTRRRGLHRRRHQGLRRRRAARSSCSSSGLSFLLMLVAFHSIVIPIKAILLNLLSTAAAYGVTRARLPGGLVRRAARDHAERGHRELGPAVHLHDPVRAVDGLPPVHPHPDQGGTRPRASTRARRWPRGSR